MRWVCVTVSRIALAAGPPLGAAALGGIAARDARRTYDRLDTPSWSPPGDAFGLAWTLLYTANAVVGWRAAARKDRSGLGLHLGQLALNATWSPLFFGAERRWAAFVADAALDAVTVAEVAPLARRDRTSSVLLMPYLAWCTSATALTASIARRNVRA